MLIYRNTISDPTTRSEHATRCRSNIRGLTVLIATKLAHADHRVMLADIAEALWVRKVV